LMSCVDGSRHKFTTRSDVLIFEFETAVNNIAVPISIAL